jgi:HSF-type DNA-binding
MDTTLLATGFPPQQENSDGAPPAVVEGTDNAAGAAGTNVDPSTQNNQLLQQQLFQQQMNMLPASLMGSSQLQQQLSALSGLTNNNGAAAAPMTNNLLNMGAMQGYLMPHQQQLFQGGFPQGLNAQLLQLGNAGVTPQQQDFSDRDQATNQVLGNNNQQLAQATMPQLQQGLNQLQQLQLMMTQQLIAAQSGGMMPANLSALFPLGNPMGNMGATLGQPSLPGVWPGFGGAPQMQQGLQLQNQGGAANAMNLLLSSLSGGATQAAAPAVAPIAAEAKPESEWAEPFVGKGKKEPPFPLKLHQILGNPEFQECISWNAHGRSWRILKPPVFEQIVIPLYFR